MMSYPALFLTSTPLPAGLVGLWEFEDAADPAEAKDHDDASGMGKIIAPLAKTVSCRLKRF